DEITGVTAPDLDRGQQPGDIQPAGSARTVQLVPVGAPPAAPGPPEAPWTPSPTNNSQPQFLISGATPGATVKLYYDRLATSYVSGAADQFGQCRVSSIYLASIPPPWIWTGFPEGTHTFTATQVVGGVESAQSPATTVVFDYTCNRPTINFNAATGILSGTS